MKHIVVLSLSLMVIQPVFSQIDPVFKQIVQIIEEQDHQSRETKFLVLKEHLNYHLAYASFTCDEKFNKDTLAERYGRNHKYYLYGCKQKLSSNINSLTQSSELKNFCQNMFLKLIEKIDLKARKKATYIDKGESKLDIKYFLELHVASMKEHIHILDQKISEGNSRERSKSGPSMMNLKQSLSSQRLKRDGSHLYYKKLINSMNENYFKK